MRDVEEVGRILAALVLVAGSSCFLVRGAVYLLSKRSALLHVKGPLGHERVGLHLLAGPLGVELLAFAASAAFFAVFAGAMCIPARISAVQSCVYCCAALLGLEWGRQGERGEDLLAPDLKEELKKSFYPCFAICVFLSTLCGSCT